MYHKISKEDYENEEFEYYYTDSNNSFDGMPGKKYSELYQNEEIDEYKKGDEHTIFLILNKVNNLNPSLVNAKVIMKSVIKEMIKDANLKHAKKVVDIGEYFFCQKLLNVNFFIF